MASINQINLQTATESTTSNVSLYSGEAEITRVFAFSVKNGLNKVTMYGLSPSLRQDTLRVEGQGRAFIKDVTVSKTPDPSRVNTYPTDPLIQRSLELRMALEGRRQSRHMLSSYLKVVKPNDVPFTQLDGMLDSFVALTQKADARLLDLERQIADVDDEIAKRPPRTSADQMTCRWQVSVLLDADEDDEVKLLLKYVVRGADWTPSYDIRVNTQKKTDNIVIVYKALISQSTGENWRDTPLILETLSPSLGNPPTNLAQWPLSVLEPALKLASMPMTGMPMAGMSMTGIPMAGMPMAGMPMTGMPMTGIPMAGMPMTGIGGTAPIIIQEESYSSHSDQLSGCRQRTPPPMDTPAMIPRSDKGSLSVTFQVSGLVDIPSDGAQHHVTISTIKLDADIHWFSIPKVDTRVYLTARIKNDTEYTFVKGKANVFVDGSFVASSAIPLVSPQETFQCPLGSDLAVKIRYPPREQRASQTGIISRSSVRSYTQRITIQNTKSISLESFKIIDNIPISQDERIKVNLISPALSAPVAGPVQASHSRQSLRKSIKLESGVQAQWDKSDEKDVEDSMVGKDGKINWLLTIPPRKTVNLALQFEVTYPTGISLTGLGSDP
ncbi:hypothetical protein CPB83DRAFT_885409 [Crepidotus variabilis]|uniref:Uncharacterized protein n=1 Tax=Crepidotus variabilis TaxID=179855 RepID=A0A9P6EAR2_9AGAR|nr:hypothetical protein CPB83DRAFT_885409 [Crepidotus variabilis]